MTVKHLISELLKYEMDAVVTFHGVDFGSEDRLPYWDNIWLTGDRFNPKIIPSINEEHCTQEWVEWTLEQEALRDNK
jgi:hypothetical protein